jgi:3-hydroxybutyryl-CoA dehydratase
MQTDSFESINLGDEAEIVHVISDRDVDAFALLTGDNNPLHMDAGAYSALNRPPKPG